MDVNANLDETVNICHYQKQIMTDAQNEQPKKNVVQWFHVLALESQIQTCSHVFLCICVCVSLAGGVGMFTLPVTVDRGLFHPD